MNLRGISLIPENYSCLKKFCAPYKYKKIIDQLSTNKDLCILKQGRTQCFANGQNQIYKQMFRNP